MNGALSKALIPIAFVEAPPEPVLIEEQPDPPPPAFLQSTAGGMLVLGLLRSLLGR